MKASPFVRNTLAGTLRCAIATLSHAGGDTVSGTGRIMTPPFYADPQTYAEFEPKFAAAVHTATPDRVWLLLADRDASAVNWSGADRIKVLEQWCKSEKALWVLYELDTKGTPELVQDCGGTGSVSTGMISTINGLASVAPTWEAFDGKVVRGRIRSGSGFCGDDYCEHRGDYTVDVSVK